MAKPPAFQFYPKDWLSDRRVRTMTLSQQGLYLMAMCHYWLEAELPVERDALLRLFGLEAEVFDRDWRVVRRHFRRDRRTLYQPRLREQLEKSAAFVAKQRAAGTASGRSRQGFNKAKVEPPAEGDQEAHPVPERPLSAHLVPIYRPFSAGFLPGPRPIRVRRPRKNIEQFRKKPNGGSTTVQPPLNPSSSSASADQDLKTPPSPPPGGVWGGESDPQETGMTNPDAPQALVDGNDVWELWRRVALEHAFDIRLACSPVQFVTCVELAKAYPPAELERAMTAWWNSRYTGGRNIGLFASQIAEVLHHLSVASGEFRAPVKSGPMLATAPSRHAASVPLSPQGSGLDWLCPHDPHCGSRGGCQRLQDIAAMKADLKRQQA